jgi:hypothetical protein
MNKTARTPDSSVEMQQPLKHAKGCHEELLTPFSGLTGLTAGCLEALPNQPGSKELRRAGLLQMQQSHGNVATRSVSAHCALRDEGEAVQGAEEDPVLDPSGPEVAEELPGHGTSLTATMVQRDNGGGSAAPAAGTTATINFVANPPSIDRWPEQAISAAHGRPNTAGWCTPRHDIQVPNLTQRTITVNATLDFMIELASEYSGGRLNVLQDHEQAHVIIGTRVARETLVTGRKAEVETMPDISARASIQAALNRSSSNFSTREGTESQIYDDNDYPRMVEAYFGVRAPLADLAAAAPNVQSLVTAVTAFNFQTESSVTTGASNTAQVAAAVTSAASALDSVNHARLQYNPEFKVMVATGKEVAESLKHSLPESERQVIGAMTAALGEFNWTPVV